MKKIYLGSVLALLMIVDAAVAQQWGLYTLYAPKNASTAYLIDTANTPATFHSWSFSSTKKTIYSTYMVKGDTIYRNYKPSGNTWNTGPCHGGFQKVLWNGTVVWDWTYYQNGSYTPHHDMCPMPNGNLLIICIEAKTGAQAQALGATYNQTVYSESILEVKPTGPTTGSIVWEWHLWDHMCQNTDAAKPNYVTSFINNPQLMNINYAGTGNLPDRYHMNGIDYNPTLNQIAFSMHFMNSVFVIDHSTTTAEAAGHTGGNSGKGGDFLYRWGNPASYGATGTTIFNVVHDAHWVPSDNPLYPNYLCGFNNNANAGNSKVDIWSPPYNGYNYTLNTGQAFAPSSYAYEYTSSFTSTNEGNSQQLPNGNMLVNNSFGSIYEVNSAGTTLWTKTNAGSSHAYRFTKCFVRGPIVTAGATPLSVMPGAPVSLSSSATSVTETNPTYTYSWSSIPSGFSSTLQNPSVTPTGPTTYIVTITNTALGCSDTASVTVDVVTGINENEDQDALIIFPNPTTGIININGEIRQENPEIVLYDALGKEIMHETMASKLDISGFENGIYYLLVKTDNGKIISKKINLIKN